MFKKLKNVGKKEVTLTEPNKSSLEPSNEKDPRDKLKKDKSSGGSKSGSIDGSKRDKKKDRDGKGECPNDWLPFIVECWVIFCVCCAYGGLLTNKTHLVLSNSLSLMTIWTPSYSPHHYQQNAPPLHQKNTTSNIY